MVQVFRNVYILALLLVIPGAAFAQGGSVQEKGIAIFVEKRCYTCHTVKAEAAQIDAAKTAFAQSKGVELKEESGDKDAKGGDLSNVGAEEDAAWFATFLKDPEGYFQDTPECKKLAKQKDRKKFKGSDADLQALTAWLATLKYGDMQDPGFQNCLKEE